MVASSSFLRTAVAGSEKTGGSGTGIDCAPTAASHKPATSFASSQEIFSVLLQTNQSPFVLPSNWIGHWQFLKPWRSSSDSKLRSCRERA